ncbi:MAG TPA: glycosyltransferase family 4 protein [Xanthobacteraceae bacterium]|jgi:glycosyltransferase involved in cell wall biosynthesis|nr:glycosyltransferase family 4 protein [Xanthobacteraceae bacterium]
MRLGIVTSHPIQYQVPLFRALAAQVDLTVYFAHKATGTNQAEAGFDNSFDWDTDLTSGFRHVFLENVSKRPSITRFSGCDTPSIGEIIARGNMDAVTVYGWHFKSYFQAARACRNLGVPVMVRTDSHLMAPRSFLKRAARAMVHPILLRQFDLFLPTGTRSAQYLHRYGVPESRVHSVPYCIDTDTFGSVAKQGEAARERLRAQFGVAAHEAAILFVGKFVKLKEIPTLIEAVATLANAGMSLRLVLVGSGPLAGELVRFAEGRRLPVTFAGFVNQSRMPEVYAAADVVVLPSSSETWGLVVNEAFASGVPAIVSNQVGCGPDVILDGLTGTIVPVGDVRALAKAIEYWVHGSTKPCDEVVQGALREMTMRYSPASSAAAFVAAAERAVAIGREGMH